MYSKGAFLEPTILLNVPISSAAYQEEIFGPVVVVNSFESEEEVLSETNCTEFGLFCEFNPRFNPESKLGLTAIASVYTKDFERAIRVTKAIESGAVGVNCSVPLRAVDMPIGGYKQSGVGRELSLHGLNMYTEMKTVYMKYGQDQTTLSTKWHSS